MSERPDLDAIEARMKEDWTNIIAAGTHMAQLATAFDYARALEAERDALREQALDGAAALAQLDAVTRDWQSMKAQRDALLRAVPFVVVSIPDTERDSERVYDVLSAMDVALNQLGDMVPEEYVAMPTQDALDIVLHVKRLQSRLDALREVVRALVAPNGATFWVGTLEDDGEHCCFCHTAPGCEHYSDCPVARGQALLGDAP